MMSDVVVSALITVGGMLGVAIVTSLVQWRVTRAVIASEHAQMIRQIQGESDARGLERRQGMLLDVLAELVVTTDPEINPVVEYGKAVRLIHKAHLLLNREVEGERRLNGELNSLGLVIRDYVSASQQAEDEGDGFDELEWRKRILSKHGRVIDLSQAVLLGYSGESFLLDDQH